MSQSTMLINKTPITLDPEAQVNFLVGAERVMHPWDVETSTLGLSPTSFLLLAGLNSFRFSSNIFLLI